MSNTTALPISKRKPLIVAMTTGILSLSLIGCGGGDDGGSNSNNGGGNNSDTTPPATSGASFSKMATWEVTDFSEGATSCYDFDGQVASDCSDNKWDIKLENQARGIKLWSNSGDSGTGKGGVFGLMDWSDLSRYKNATQDPDTGRDITMHYNEDRSGGIFDEQPWHEYNLNGKHQLYPNNRIYLITTDNSSADTQSSVLQPIYAMQIINYYNDGGASGYPTLRWIDTALPNKVQTQTINASNNDNWIYFDLATGKSTTDKSTTWQVGFKRNSVILNGGDSGTSKVGGFLAATPTGYYDDKGEIIASKFMIDGSAATLTNLTDTASYQKPASTRSWVIDRKGSDLNPAYIGNYPNLDFGWYTYNGMTHQLNAKAIGNSQGALIRSSDGNSYARVRLDKINYPNATTTTPSSWAFTIDVQPAN